MSPAVYVCGIGGIGEASDGLIGGIFTHFFQRITADDRDSIPHRIYVTDIRHHLLTAPMGVDLLGESTVESATIATSALNQIPECALLSPQQVLNVLPRAVERFVFISQFGVVHQTIEQTRNSFVFFH